MAAADTQADADKRMGEGDDHNHTDKKMKCGNDFADKVIQNHRFSEAPSLEAIRLLQAAFIKERNWDQFHAPRNVLLAMVGEVGELAELFQWKGEVKEGLPDWSPEDKKHLGQELSDVLLYLVDLADRCHIDLPVAVQDKLAHNAAKYPVDKAYGTSKKYNEL